MVNSTFTNKLKWNFKWYIIFFVRANSFENIICKIAVIVFGPQYVNSASLSVNCFISDFVMKWKRIFQYKPFVTEMRRWPVDSFHKGPVMWSYDFSLMLARTNYWTNNRVAGDLVVIILMWRHCNVELWRIRIWMRMRIRCLGVTYTKSVMTSSNGNIFCVTGPLFWEFTGHRWIPIPKARDAELW